MPAAAIDTEFDLDLTATLARLRIYALSLTRNGDRADDLVQQTVLKALAGRDSFRPGSNFAGWIFRIQRNEFISELRRTRPIVDVFGEMAHITSVAPSQESGLIMSDLVGAFRQLPRGSREALLLAHIEGFSYRQIADRAGVAPGTVKSRISRGRASLARFLETPTTDPGFQPAWHDPPIPRLSPPRRR
jgi:RNA polymerase sigma-70 factor, ECF subfamily